MCAAQGHVLSFVFLETAAALDTNLGNGSKIAPRWIFKKGTSGFPDAGKQGSKLTLQSEPVHLKVLEVRQFQCPLNH